MSNAKKDLPATEAKEEFSSVSVVIDHLVNDVRDDGHTVISTVWSTESAQESLLSQLTYFGQTGLLRNSNVIAMVHAASQKAVAIVYTISDRQTNVILDAKVWGDTIAHPELGGSVMNALASVVALVGDIKKQATAAGEDSPILLYVPND